MQSFSNEPIVHIRYARIITLSIGIPLGFSFILLASALSLWHGINALLWILGLGKLLWGYWFIVIPVSCMSYSGFLYVSAPRIVSDLVQKNRSIFYASYLFSLRVSLLMYLLLLIYAILSWSNSEQPLSFAWMALFLSCCFLLTVFISTLTGSYLICAIVKRRIGKGLRLYCQGS